MLPGMRKLQERGRFQLVKAYGEKCVQAAKASNDTKQLGKAHARYAEIITKWVFWNREGNIGDWEKRFC